MQLCRTHLKRERTLFRYPLHNCTTCQTWRNGLQVGETCRRNRHRGRGWQFEAPPDASCGRGCRRPEAAASTRCRPARATAAKPTALRTAWSSRRSPSRLLQRERRSDTNVHLLGTRRARLVRMLPPHRRTRSTAISCLARSPAAEPHSAPASHRLTTAFPRAQIGTTGDAARRCRSSGHADRVGARIGRRAGSVGAQVGRACVFACRSACGRPSAGRSVRRMVGAQDGRCAGRSVWGVALT